MIKLFDGTAGVPPAARCRRSGFDGAVTDFRASRSFAGGTPVVPAKHLNDLGTLDTTCAPSYDEQLLRTMKLGAV